MDAKFVQIPLGMNKKNKDFPSFWYEFSRKSLLIDHLYRARIRQPRKVMENLEYPDKDLGLKRSFLHSMVTLMELRHPKIASELVDFD